MKSNPALKKLGFDNNDRVVIFHADDIGMCQGSIDAYADLLDFGILSSAAVMVPCPWFPAAAAFVRAHKSDPRLDMGVHLTLNSEWANFRWGPVSTRAPQSGLVDELGHFFDDTSITQAKADPTAVRIELQTQIDHALTAGIEPTHIDSHMIALLHPRFLPIYFDLARRYRLPAFMVRTSAARLMAEGYDQETAVALARIIQEAEASGIPMLDHFHMMSLENPVDRLDQAIDALRTLPPGITYFIIHPVKNTPELRAMAPDWRCRVADYQLFTDDAWQEAVEQSGVQVIGWRTLRDCMRKSM